MFVDIFDLLDYIEIRNEVFILNEKIKQYITENTELLNETLKELCLIPAPSHHEQKRAEYCKNWLEKYGAEGVYIDDALNVIFPLNCNESKQITVFAAHTDTVFPDMEPLPYYDDGKKVFCPGAADDTAGVVVILLAAKYYIENKILPENGIMFVLNSCEEGLGNLKGTRALFEAYKDRIKTFITLDGDLDFVVDVSVGSHRYEVVVETEGGHSFEAFGNRNAIAVASNIVAEIYKIEVPKKPSTRTTYNVGTIEGGTSVNTIAQCAKLLCEYRSDDKECLEFMKNEFERIFDEASKQADIKINMVGDRPCGDIDKEKMDALKAKMIPIIEKNIGKKVIFSSGSTDSNIPHSLGIESLCIGSNTHAGIHTREEWVDKESLKVGLEITIEASMALAK